MGKMTINENGIIKKSNGLIEASYKLTLNEQKIIMLLASSISMEDEEFKSYKFKVKDFINLTGNVGQGKYTEIKEIAKRLMQKVFEIRMGNKHILVSWLSSVTYHEGEGVIELRFDPWLKPFLLQLQSHFTKYMLRNVSRLKSSYSIRIYELCKQYENIGYRVFEIEKLRYILGIEPEQYPKYANFKQRVILQAQSELKDYTDIWFDFIEIKKGRKVDQIRFIIHSSKNELSQKEITPLREDDIDLIWQKVKEVGGQDVRREFIDQQLRFITDNIKSTDPVKYFLEKIIVLSQQTEIKKTVEDALVYFIKNDKKPGTKIAEKKSNIIDKEGKKPKTLMSSLYSGSTKVRVFKYKNKMYFLRRNFIRIIQRAPLRELVKQLSEEAV